MAQTPREVMRKTFTFDHPDRLGCCVFALPAFIWSRPDDYAAIMKEFPADCEWAPAPYDPSSCLSGDPFAEGIYVDEWGCVFTNINPGMIGEVKTPLIPELEDLSGLKPLYRKFIDCCHAAGKFAFMHSDGNIEAILPDLVELGLDIGNFQIGCMNLEKVATVAKGKLTFFGEIDRQQVLTKTPEAARTFVRNVARHLYDPAGGIVKELELGVLVEPETALTALREWDKVDREARQ